MFSISLPIIAGSIGGATTLVKSKPIPAKTPFLLSTALQGGGKSQRSDFPLNQVSVGNGGTLRRMK